MRETLENIVTLLNISQSKLAQRASIRNSVSIEEIHRNAYNRYECKVIRDYFNSIVRKVAIFEDNSQHYTIEAYNSFWQVVLKNLLEVLERVKHLKDNIIIDDIIFDRG